MTIIKAQPAFALAWFDLLVREVVVVGAGISGLAIAKVLEDRGHSVRMLERAHALPQGGAGLTLWPNALRALESLGMLEGVRDHLLEVRRAVTLTPSGRVISELPLSRIERRFGTLCSVARDELLSALRAQIAAPIEFGVEVALSDARLTDGDGVLEADLVVGADGIGSVVREYVAGRVRPRPAGYSAWRGVAPTGAGTPTAASETWGRGKRFGLVPLTRERTYWFAVMGGGDVNDDLEHAFAGWHAPIARVLEATPQADRSYLPISDLPRLARWHRHPAVLVGDAAHAMTPNLGQGAAQALEDVVALNELLGTDQFQLALEQYEQRRKPHAQRVVSQSRIVGRIAQAHNPILAATRDFVSARTPKALSARQLAAIISS